MAVPGIAAVCAGLAGCPSPGPLRLTSPICWEQAAQPRAEEKLLQTHPECLFLWQSALPANRSWSDLLCGARPGFVGMETFQSSPLGCDEAPEVQELFLNLTLRPSFFSRFAPSEGEGVGRFFCCSSCPTQSSSCSDCTWISM